MIIKDFIDYLAVNGTVNSSDVCGALKLINAARVLVYPLDDWTGTIEYGCVNLCESCFYLPYHIETVRDIWSCCTTPPLGDEIWSSIGVGCLSMYCDKRIGVTRTDRRAPIPVQPPMGSIIGIRPIDANDEGFTIRFGIRNFAGSLDNEAIIASNYNEIKYGDMIMGRIESIHKDKTNGPVELFYRDNKGVNCKFYTLMADEVSPSYYVYKATCQSGCAIIKGKKKIIPYTEKDLYNELDIQGVSGLNYAIKALEHQRASQHNEFAAALKISRSLLERTKEDLNKTSYGGKSVETTVCHPKTTFEY